MNELKTFGLFFLGLALGCLYPREFNLMYGMICFMSFGTILVFMDEIMNIRARKEALK
jgi:hypothetical protein